MEWPLSQLVIKSQFLRHLKLYDLWTTAENKSMLLNFIGEVCLHSDNLETLHLEWTETTAEDGRKLWESLANQTDSIQTLQKLTIKNEWNWFRGEEDECLAPLLIVLARLSHLTLLAMDNNKLTVEQEQRIRNAIINDKCEIKGLKLT